jgi:hypothetical protein
MSQGKTRKALEIQLEKEIAQGVYANLAVVTHTDAEVTLDFVYVQPQEMRGTVRSRVIVSPRHAKRLLMALQENLERYERAFGEIKIEAPSDPPEIPPYH